MRKMHQNTFGSHTLPGHAGGEHMHSRDPLATIKGSYQGFIYIPRDMSTHLLGRIPRGSQKLLPLGVTKTLDCVSGLLSVQVFLPCIVCPAELRLLNVI